MEDARSTVYAVVVGDAHESCIPFIKKKTQEKKRVPFYGTA
jgi:hypothetical protein